MPDAAGELLRLARHIESLSATEWRRRPAQLAQHARDCLPQHQDPARFLNLTPRQFNVLNFNPDQKDTVMLLRSLAQARRQERRPANPDNRTTAAAQQLRLV